MLCVVVDFIVVWLCCVFVVACVMFVRCCSAVLLLNCVGADMCCYVLLCVVVLCYVLRDVVVYDL